MTRKKFRTFLCVLLALAGLTAMAYTASGGAGSRSDPLVTLSYLTETFTGQVMEQVDKLIAQQDGQAAGLSQAYAVVKLSAGQTLRGRAGCEVLLRSGRASCNASNSPGLVDTTSGASVGGGTQLQINHLYLMTDARTVTASDSATLLVRGGYTVL